MNISPCGYTIRFNNGIDNFGRSFTSPRLDYFSAVGNPSTGFEDLFDDSDLPSYLLENTLHQIDYLPPIPRHHIDRIKTVSNMSNPNFIAQYREPSLSPTRHPGYKLRQPEYRPGYLTNRCHTQYNIGTTPTFGSNNTSDDLALCRTGRFGTAERISRPLVRHQVRHSRSLSTNDQEDFVHSRGVFTKTTPNVRGHFIIHPDWVSENMTPRN